MREIEAIEPGVFEAQWEKPTRVQVELTQLMASGLPRTELPKRLVEQFYQHSCEEWGSVTSSAENNVLMVLLDLTLDRGRREFPIKPDELWSVMHTMLSARVLELIDEEIEGGCPQDIHLNALKGMIDKGMVIRSFVGDDWVCSINFLWNPGFGLIPLFTARSAQSAEASLETQQHQGGGHA